MAEMDMGSPFIKPVDLNPFQLTINNNYYNS